MGRDWEEWCGPQGARLEGPHGEGSGDFWRRKLPNHVCWRFVQLRFDHRMPAIGDLPSPNTPRSARCARTCWRRRPAASLRCWWGSWPPRWPPPRATSSPATCCWAARRRWRSGAAAGGWWCPSWCCRWAGGGLLWGYGARGSARPIVWKRKLLWDAHTPQSGSTFRCLKGVTLSV